MNFKGLLTGIVLLGSGTANAATVFAPTDGDVNFLLSTLSFGTLLAMFDDSDQSYTGSSLAITVPEIVGIAGPTGSGDFIATNESAATLTLSGSDQFILGISTDGGSTWSGDTSVTYLGANAYTVSFSDGSVLEVDVQVIPVPAAVWLFGTGLVGLVAVARRRG